MADYSLIIIGGGLSGLAAGIRFARFGGSVLILEKHFIPGGLNSYYYRKGILFETGLHDPESKITRIIDAFEIIDDATALEHHVIVPVPIDVSADGDELKHIRRFNPQTGEELSAVGEDIFSLGRAGDIEIRAQTITDHEKMP